ncbi:MAG: hypothetical protein IJB10_05140 [Clostridia bacterium]|nr:hypothetical protein [Clostridia bacterium]
MGEISSWILSITGIILVILIVEIVLPNGKTNKLIKSIVSVFSIFVIISPLKNFELSSLNISSMFKSEMQIDSDFINNRNNEKIIAFENLIEKTLFENGYKNVKITIKGTYNKERLEIETAFVDLRELVLLDKNLNINKYTNIMAIIKKIISVEEERLIFYE